MIKIATCISAVLLLMATATQVRAQEPSNPLFSTHFYNEHTYRVLGAQRNHEQALQDVAEWNATTPDKAYLIQLTTLAERASVTGWLDEFGNFELWHGANDSQWEGNWFYSSGPAFNERGRGLIGNCPPNGECWTPPYWAEFNPTGGSNGIDCMTFDSQSGLFADEPCVGPPSSSQTYVVLEYGQTCKDYETDLQIADSNANACPVNFIKKTGFDSIVCDNLIQSCAEPLTCCNAIPIYTVTPSVFDGGGTIDPSVPQEVLQGETVQFTLTPDANNYIAQVGGTCGGTLNGNTYTTNAINATCTVLANFDPPDSDGSLTAAATVSEPVPIDTTAWPDVNAVDIFDFTLSDGGTADGFPMEVSQIVVNVSGTASDTLRGNMGWFLSGPDTGDFLFGSYSPANDTITFLGLNISVADGLSEQYTIKASYGVRTGVTEGLTFILSVDGDTDVTVSSSGTQMGATSAVTNGTGSTTSVTAQIWQFTTQPANSVSGTALGTQPVVTAQDCCGNTDIDFTGTVTLTAESGIIDGLLTNNSAAASNGVATFSDLIYTATADQEVFRLYTAAPLFSPDSDEVISDVVATTLVFDTQPDPLSVNSGDATIFSTVPVVSARDDNSVIDTGYNTGISLAEVNGAGSATLSATGDTDGNASSVTVTPSSGVATFTDMQITYTVSGASSETFNLQASSGGLSTANSSEMTGVVSGDPCNLKAYSDVTTSIPELFEACEKLVIGPTFTAEEGADIVLSSGEDIEFTPGVSINSGATLNAAVCGQSLCSVSDQPMPEGCHSCVTEICDTSPECCLEGWGGQCVDKVDTTCGLVCE